MIEQIIKNSSLPSEAGEQFCLTFSFSSVWSSFWLRSTGQNISDPAHIFHTCCVEANIWSFHCVHETYVLPSWLLNLRIVAVIKLVFWLSYFIWPWNCEHEYFLQLGENSWLIYFFFHWSLFLIWPWRVWGRVIVYPPSWMFVAPVWISVALMRGLVCRSWKYLSP